MQTRRFVLFGVLVCGCLSSCGRGRDAEVTATLFGKANVPVLNPASGTYSSAQSVEIVTDTLGAVIYYTTDGSNPNTSARMYGGPISVTADLTLKAMAVAPGYAQSNVASANYVFNSNYPPDTGLPIPPRFVAPTVGPDSVKTPGGLKVVNWAGFRGAITYTFDDSAQANEYSELRATGQRMTFFLNCSLGYDAVWLQAARDGQEIGNHTQNHCRADGTKCAGGPWAGSIEAEYDECTQYLKQAYGVDNVWTTAAPYGDKGYDSVARSRFFLNRGTKENRVSADDGTNPYHLPTHTPKRGDKASELNSIVDHAAQRGDWRIFELHGLKANSDWASIDVKELIANITYAKSRGDVWIDSMVNVGAYWMGQDAFENAVETQSGSETTLKWTLPPHFPSGKYVRVISTKGLLKQGDQVIRRSNAGYFEVALDPGTLTIVR